jgi:hypothetical protein
VAQWFVNRTFDLQEYANTLQERTNRGERLLNKEDYYEDFMCCCAGCGYYWKLQSILPVVISTSSSNLNICKEETPNESAENSEDEKSSNEDYKAGRKASTRGRKKRKRTEDE